MASSLLIGLGAGAASALLFASASAGTIVGLVVLLMLAPMPVAISGLGWGWASAAVAAASAFALLTVIAGPRAATVHSLAIGMPNVAISYLALLSRQHAGPTPGSQILEWYPVGRLIAWCAAWAGVLATAAMLATGPGPDEIRAALAATLDRMVSVGGLPAGDGGVRSLTEPEKKAFVEIMLATLPWAIASSWMVMAVLNVWGAAHVNRLSGRLMRPWPDFSATTLPRLMPVAFAASLALSALPDMPGLAAAGFASGILFAYLLVGLAILHTLTRGMQARPMILSFVYFSLVMLSPFSSLIVALIGLAEPVSPLRRGRGSPPPTSPPPQSPSS